LPERKKANEAGIRSYPLEKVERGSAEVKQAYFGIRITLGNQTEVIPVAYSAENIEYQLLNLLKKMTRKGKQSNLGIVKVEGAFNYPEPSQSSSKDTFGVFIHKVYSPEYGEPTEVNLNQEEVNSEISTLLLVGAPRLTEQGMYHLDQYLMKGGNLIYLAETMKFSLPSGGRSMPGMGMSDGFATAIESAKNMRDFTSNYGFEVKSTDGRPVADQVVRAIVMKDTDKNTYPFIVYNNGTIESLGSVAATQYSINNVG
jgi:hypothetical protein